MRLVKVEGLDRGYVEMLIGNCLCQMLTRYDHFDFFIILKLKDVYHASLSRETFTVTLWLAV